MQRSHPAHDRAASAQVATNSLGIRLVRIAAGEFQMGSGEPLERLASAFPGYEPERIAGLVDEYPAHGVTISRPFWLGAFQVTIAQFARFVAATGYRTQAEHDGTGGWGYNPGLGDFEGRRFEFTWRNPGFRQETNHPVVNVTWHDAAAFCLWLSSVEEQHYRLPTEAEWEYACRAGSGTRYHCGDDPESLVSAANLFDASSGRVLPAWQRYALRANDGHPFTAPVGSFAANDFGVHDMHGNVWEWCGDWYAADYYAGSPASDPAGPPRGELRVRRGGAWHSWALYARSSFRNYNTPSSRYVNLGFRVVCDE
ncbi:MAG: formylglycine-generating enzyme family protein [Planctomycetes bacterium]|nr:formylglycine-generating enzyme family protein [Planctomycetota bacterium]